MYAGFIGARGATHLRWDATVGEVREGPTPRALQNRDVHGGTRGFGFRLLERRNRATLVGRGAAAWLGAHLKLFRLTRERSGLKRLGAEGATAPETLRQRDRDQPTNFWREMRLASQCVSADGIILSGTATEGAHTMSRQSRLSRGASA